MTVEEFTASLAGMQKTLEKAVAVELHEHAKEVAKTASDYLGEYQPGWAPLAASTIAKHGDTPLMDTRELKDEGITVQEIETAGAIHTDSIGSSLEKALFNERGTAKAPPRPFLSLALAETYDHLEKRVEVTVDNALDEVFGG